jgi:nitrate/TMAO reductase-like tetraheme cytochrome c subunit
LGVPSGESIFLAKWSVIMKLPRSTHNWITVTGAMIAIVALFMIIFFVGISVFLGRGRAYLGLLTYVLLPTIMILGLLLIPIGMLLQSRRDRKRALPEAAGWPHIDLNDRRNRNAFFVFATGTCLLLFFSAIGSYDAYNYTDSVEFCGRLCHSVMKPEYTAYQHSPHARIACVECHVGPGASWYVRSKLSGLYQVYAVIFDKYPRPIPTPIKNLRPAREVCEQCHWPGKFYNQTIRIESHYLPDEKNTEWNIYLVMRIAAEQPALGLAGGIHWHINPEVRIEYMATDKEQLHIPWVRYRNLRTGHVTVFQTGEKPARETQIRAAGTRVMDCMDCHNRPSHDFQAPTVFINNAITSGVIPKELPYIKAQALKVCEKKYPTSDEAVRSIEQALQKYYQEKYPDLGGGREELVDRAAAGLKQGFSDNIFPFMRARWSAYPNNIGHMEYIGCFRCHDGKHTSPDGEAISHKCDFCHVLNAQGNPNSMQVAELDHSLEFKHPEDIGGVWKEMLCSDCHTGLNP